MFKFNITGGLVA